MLGMLQQLVQTDVEAVAKRVAAVAAEKEAVTAAAAASLKKKSDEAGLLHRPEKAHASQEGAKA